MTFLRPITRDEKMRSSFDRMDHYFASAEGKAAKARHAKWVAEFTKRPKAFDPVGSAEDRVEHSTQWGKP